MKFQLPHTATTKTVLAMINTSGMRTVVQSGKEQTMSEDLIKRSDAIKDLCDISNNSDMPEDWHRGMSVAISALYRVPSADRPQGE